MNQNITTIKERKHVNFLGMTLDKHVSWKAHIDVACSKINRFV